MRFTIWYHLHNFKKVGNTHGGALVWSLFSCFIKYANGTESRKAFHLFSLFIFFFSFWYIKPVYESVTKIDLPEISS